MVMMVVVLATMVVLWVEIDAGNAVDAVGSGKDEIYDDGVDV
jgi:hypothetical protein